MTLDDARLSSMALGNGPYKRYSLRIKNNISRIFHVTYRSEENSDFYCFNKISIA